MGRATGNIEIDINNLVNRNNPFLEFDGAAIGTIIRRVGRTAAVHPVKDRIAIIQPADTGRPAIDSACAESDERLDAVSQFHKRLAVVFAANCAFDNAHFRRRKILFVHQNRKTDKFRRFDQVQQLFMEVDYRDMAAGTA